MTLGPAFWARPGALLARIGMVEPRRVLGHIAGLFRIDTLGAPASWRRAVSISMWPRQMAEALSEALGEVNTADLATKTDIAELRAEMERRFSDLHRHLWFGAVGVVTLTVTLVKLIP